MKQLTQIKNTKALLKEAINKENTKQFHEAIALYETVISDNQNEFCAYYNLGALYEKIQEINKAKNIYAQGIQVARKLNNNSVETDLSYTLLGLID